MDYEIYLLFRALLRLYDIRNVLARTLEEIEFLPSDMSIPSGIDPQYYEIAAPAVPAISQQIDAIEARLHELGWPERHRNNPGVWF